jgi:hypothetical protein
MLASDEQHRTRSVRIEPQISMGKESRNTGPTTRPLPRGGNRAHVSTFLWA